MLNVACGRAYLSGENRLQHNAPAHAKAALRTPGRTRDSHTHTLRYCGLKSLEVGVTHPAT